MLTFWVSGCETGAREFKSGCLTVSFIEGFLMVETQDISYTAQYACQKTQKSEKMVKQKLVNAEDLTSNNCSNISFVIEKH